MKAGGQGAEQPVEREVSGKRPKRKCLQWHPLLSKKTLDFSEDEEEEHEEEPRKPLLVFGINQSQGTEGGAATEEEENDEEEGDPSERRARRPMNAFLLFCKRHRSLVRQEHPQLDNRGATKILADWWAVLDPKEKQTYTDMAKEYKDAFMKANPGYKWCPPSKKSMKTPPSSAGSGKKAWPFPSEPSKDCATPKKLAKAEGVPQIQFSMADPTEMGGLSMLLYAGERALTAHEISPGTSRLRRTGLAKACVNTILPVCHPPEVSLALQGSLSEDRQSALFQLAEMCLASEANKTVTSAPRPGCQSTRGQARVNQGAPLSSLSVSSCPSSLSASSTPSEDAPSWQGQLQNLKKKRKKKKKKNREGYGASEVIVRSMYPPFKPFKRSPSSESDLESLIDTIDAVAKGSWCTEHDRAEPPAKKPCPFSNPSHGKRKSRPIERKSSKLQVDEVVAEEKDHKPVLEGSPETEQEGEVASVRDEAYACALLTLAPPSPSAIPTNNDDKMAAQLEHCGYRKSERSCKGALYKTLVSEGMLTSLRASVDRGRRTSGRGSISDLEGNWAEDGWTFTQLGGNNCKKLKKAKLKEEYAPGLGKLEVQFEKNSLPQYSPLTFDRKTTCLIKKKKSGVNGLEHLPIPLRGSSPSIKKNSFRKIIRKYKNKKEQPATMDKAMETQGLSGPHITQEAKPAGPSPPPYPESPGGAEALVGSQKRKARKRKITHLVRTADGRVSPAEGDQARETLDKELGPSNCKLLCNKERSGLQETCASTTLTADHAGESGHREFFSLAALAEVAATENVQRGQHTASLPQESQSEEIALTHVLISCGNQ